MGDGVEFLIGSGVNIEAEEPDHPKDTTLRKAPRQGHSLIIKTLVANGVRVDAVALGK